MIPVRQRLALAVLASALCCLATAPPAGAQTTTATLRGTVTDEGGPPVAGASLVALNTDSGFTVSDETNAAGAYAMTLQPGAYEVTVAAAGKEPLSESPARADRPGPRPSTSSSAGRPRSPRRSP